MAMLDGLWKDMGDPLGRKPGEALWPDKYDTTALARIRANLEETGQGFEWWALFQQQPRPQDGAFFNINHFEIVDKPDEEDEPSTLRQAQGAGSGDPESMEFGRKIQWVRYCDLALSEKKTADFNTSVAVGMGKSGKIYLRDMIRVQGWGPFKDRLIAAATSEAERGTIWYIEDVAFQALAWQELMTDPRLVGTTIRKLRPQGDKVERARPLQARGEAGKLKLIRGPWNQTFIQECLDFPKGRHDDQVDTASGGLIALAGRNRKLSVVKNPFFD
jgi:predicted phage terminase large subunit-like protein